MQWICDKRNGHFHFFLFWKHNLFVRHYNGFDDDKTINYTSTFIKTSMRPWHTNEKKNMKNVHCVLIEDVKITWKIQRDTINVHHECSRNGCLTHVL